MSREGRSPGRRHSQCPIRGWIRRQGGGTRPSLLPGRQTNFRNSQLPRRLSEAHEGTTTGEAGAGDGRLATSFVHTKGEGACGGEGRLVDDFGDASWEVAADEQSQGEVKKRTRQRKQRRRAEPKEAKSGGEVQLRTTHGDEEGDATVGHGRRRRVGRVTVVGGGGWRRVAMGDGQRRRADHGRQRDDAEVKMTGAGDDGRAKAMEVVAVCDV